MPNEESSHFHARRSLSIKERFEVVRETCNWIHLHPDKASLCENLGKALIENSEFSGAIIALTGPDGGLESVKGIGFEGKNAIIEAKFSEKFPNKCITRACEADSIVRQEHGEHSCKDCVLRDHLSKFDYSLNAPIRFGGSKFGYLIAFLTAQRNGEDAPLSFSEILQNLGFALQQREQQITAVQNLEKIQASENSRDEYLSVLSHEIRNPLHGILGIIELLRSENGDSGKEKEFQVLYYSGQVLLESVNNILDHNRIKAGYLEINPEKVDLTQQLQQFEAMMQATAKLRSITFHLDCRIPKIPRLIDWPRIRQVLGNLLSNSFKFTPAKGKVELMVVEKIPGWLLFRITDSGIGIPPDKIDGIFIPFTQAHGPASIKAGGNGMGLFICKSIIDAYGGRISVTSEAGRGTVFRFEIPSERVS